MFPTVAETAGIGFWLERSAEVTEPATPVKARANSPARETETTDPLAAGVAGPLTVTPSWLKAMGWFEPCGAALEDAGSEPALVELLVEAPV
jgi:hypothetical protein